MTTNNNPMMCDLKTGICGDGEAGEGAFEIIDLNPKPKIALFYVTDPICSHCWALEPVLNQFIAQYGHYFDMQIVMGGLLESWEGFADVKNGIQKPADVGEHWREVGEHARMPIDGSLWTDNPIQSSYPPSRLFKVIQEKDAALAETYLRLAREAVFAFNRNIADETVMKDIANTMGLDGEALVAEAQEPAAQQLLEDDFALAQSLTVRGFPTIVMINEEQKGVKVVGAQSLAHYVQGLQQMTGDTNLKPRPVPTLHNYLQKQKRLFAKEIEVMYDVEASELEAYIGAQLPASSYTLHPLLGEQYIEWSPED